MLPTYRGREPIIDSTEGFLLRRSAGAPYSIYAMLKAIMGIPLNKPNTLCHCGKPLHYPNEQTQLFVEAMDKFYGPMMTVAVGNRSWLIPRQYLAAHQLALPQYLPNGKMKAATIASVAAAIVSLGFQEVQPSRNEPLVKKASVD